MSSILAQLRAVLWKAWCSRKFHYIYTILDIILPLILAYVIVIFKGQNNRDEIEPEKIFKPNNKDFLLQNSYDKLNVLYAPNSTAANSIMSRVRAKLNPDKVGDFMAMKDAIDMENWLYNDSLASSLWEQAYGIEFHNVSENALEYSIKNTKFDIWHTNLLFPEFPIPGPMESGTNYISQGFLALQIAIDEAFMNYKGVNTLNWNLQELPYPEYRRLDRFSLIYKEALPLLLCYGYLFSVVSLIRKIGEEKESGIRERLRMIGLKPWTTYLGWIIDCALVSLVTSAFLAIMLTAPWISKNGAILEKANFLVIWITIYLFYLSGTLLALTVANLFTRPKYSVVIGILIWFLSFGFFTYVLNNSPSYETLFFMSMIPNGYLLSSMNAVAHLEVLGTGARFSSLFHYSGRDGIILPLGCAWIAVLSGLIVFGALILYLDAILPGQYGVAKPWYFMMPQVKDGSEDFVDCPVKVEGQFSKDSKVICEPLLGSLPVGIQIRKLSKTYGTVHALKDFSIDIYKNEITALLGHNGAGKTTLLSVMTGMLAPSSGHVLTDGYSVFENLAKFRNDLGYCPQDDLLLPNLTVAEHIIFFGMVKGLTISKATSQANTIMAKCRLSGKHNTRVAGLSGGMKRKLCLAISLVNSPKILILDEPTSGLDPESRRAIWDILLELRNSRTILLTTHFMEEADVVGDRIAIMSHGELKCYGTSLFLKKNYGANQNCLDFLRQVKLKSTVLFESPESITIQLPLNSVIKFPILFEQLEFHQKVKSLAVSCTTIDDVFQKVNEEEGVKFSVDEVDMPVPYSQLQSEVPFSIIGYATMVKIEGGLFWRRLCAIKEKKLIWIYRNWIITLLYLVLPLLIVVIAIYKTSTSASIDELKPLPINLNIYGRTDVVLDDNRTNLGASFWYEIQNTQSTIVMAETSSVVQALLEYGRKDEAKYRTAVLVAGSMNEDSPTVLYSSIGYHSIPIAVNLISNAIMNRASPNLSNYHITTYNDPYLFNSDSCSGGASEVAMSISFTIVLVMELTFIMSYFMIHVHMERSTMFKGLQLLTGLRYYYYWLFTFIVDFFIYVCIISLLLAVMLIFDASAVIRDWVVLGEYFKFFWQAALCNFILVFLLFGVSSLWCVYFYSFFFRTYNGSTLFYTVISVALCIAGVIIYFFDAYKHWKYVFFLNPLNPLAAAIFKILSDSKFNKMCEICKGSSIAIMCKGTTKREMETDGDRWDDFNNSKELIYLGVDWIPYMVLIYMIESGVVSFIWHHLKSLYIGEVATFERPLDKDVYEEKQKIQNRQINVAGDDQVLVVNGLAKKYSRNMSAVKDVTFGVSPGQCFGLLGTNGAGKSTTFQMLTNYIRPTRGDATVNAFSLIRARNQYKDQIGYCPQSAGLMGDLTGKETLRLFAALNGEPSTEVEHIVQKWLNLLGLKEYENRPTSTYSGGNLRKLSTAIALIGNPPVVFLDEPTTGVDPVTRRKIWQVLRMSLAKNQTVVIASHSMDECEALCDRLTIMAEGTMHCIGNIQHLKKTHGKGFTILIKLGIITGETLTKLKQKMESLFSHLCTLRDEHKGLLHYHLEDPTYKWSTLFRNIAELKAEFPAVEDYVLTDSSLEQIFLSFAAETNTA
uniref:ABC transporter domain-containing protein n=1 Tax=Rhodnius prolixus TaxID=13249 RepID=T1IBQ4_RHOPR